MIHAILWSGEGYKAQVHTQLSAAGMLLSLPLPWPLLMKVPTAVEACPAALLCETGPFL